MKWTQDSQIKHENNKINWICIFYRNLFGCSFPRRIQFHKTFRNWSHFMGRIYVWLRASIYGSFWKPCKSLEKRVYLKLESISLKTLKFHILVRSSWGVVGELIIDENYCTVMQLFGYSICMFIYHTHWSLIGSVNNIGRKKSVIVVQNSFAYRFVLCPFC